MSHLLQELEKYTIYDAYPNVISHSYLCETKKFVHVLVPLVAAVGARLLALPEPAHDGLQDGGKRCNPDPRCDEHGVLGTKHVARRSTKRAINVYLGNDYFDSFVNRFVASNDLDQSYHGLSVCPP